MCYTGKCHYENYWGECTLESMEDIPDDASCALLDRAIEEERREHD